MPDSRATKKLPPLKPTTYSVTLRKDPAVNVSIDDKDDKEVVSIAVGDQSMTLGKNAARRLVAALLEKLG